MKNPGISPSPEFSNDSSPVVRTRANRVMRAIGCKSMLFLAALSIGGMGLPLTVHASDLSMQRQIETLQRQLEQQQAMMEQQQA